MGSSVHLPNQQLLRSPIAKRRVIASPAFKSHAAVVVVVFLSVLECKNARKNYVGRITPIGDNLHLLADFNRGAQLNYRVDFPTTSPLPRLTALIVNDNVLCYSPGDIPGPNQYVTTTSLQHTLFLKGQGPSIQGGNNFQGQGGNGFQGQGGNNFQGQGGNNFHDHEGNGFYNQYEPTETKPEVDPDIAEFLGPIANDGQTQIFSFGDDNRQGSWNGVNFEKPITRPPQRPEPPQYFPELITQPPTQQPPPPPRRPEYRPPPPVQDFPTIPSRAPVPIPETTTSGPIQCGVVSGGNERLPLIFNGQTYNRGDWPWLVAIYKRKDGSLNFICSGTLVSDRHVITAAHCMHQKNTQSSQRDIVVKVGVYNLEDWGDDITVTRTLSSAYIHESYNATSLANDISVLIFERRVEFNTNIRPACLWSGNPDLSRIVGASGVVAGWGQSELGVAGRGEPRVVRIPIVSTAVCRASRPDFHKLTSSRTLCAGDRKGSGPCLGDSGGGLYLLEGGRWRVRGVVSLSLRPDSGDSTCNLNEYIVFTDSAQYLDWIHNIMSY